MSKQLFPGILLTIFLSMLAKLSGLIPVISMFGSMITAIILGITARPVLEDYASTFQSGVSFVAKTVLRLGIILMGLRLNITDICNAGWRIMLLDIAVVVFTISFISYLGKNFNIKYKLRTLIAVGTGVCGAAAIGAIAPVIKAKEEDIALSVGIISILGTIFTLLSSSANTLFFNMPADIFGIFAGSSLHELGHVIAAAASAGQASSDYAILVKLGRVSLIAPVALVIGHLYNRRQQNNSKFSLSFPYFILGFLAMALINSFFTINSVLIHKLTDFSSFLLTMAMAAFGFNVKINTVKKAGARPFFIALAGTILLNIFVFVMLYLLGIV